MSPDGIGQLYRTFEGGPPAVALQGVRAPHLAERSGKIVTAFCVSVGNVVVLCCLYGLFFCSNSFLCSLFLQLESAWSFDADDRCSSEDMYLKFVENIG